IGKEWGVEPPAEPGPTELELVRAFGNGVRGAFVLGENPAVTKLDSETVASGLDALDFLLVQDVTHTETTAHADVVLPASIWSEKSGTVTNLDRQVQRMHAMETPPDAARRDFDILATLGDRLTDCEFDYDDPAAVFAELTAANPQYAGMSEEDLDSGSQRWPFPESATAGTDVLHRDTFVSGERRAPFTPVITGDCPVDADDDGLVLITGSRSGDIANTTMGGSVGTAEKTLAIHPTDADE